MNEPQKDWESILEWLPKMSQPLEFVEFYREIKEQSQDDTSLLLDLLNNFELKLLSAYLLVVLQVQKNKIKENLSKINIEVQKLSYTSNQFGLVFKERKAYNDFFSINVPIIKNDSYVFKSVFEHYADDDYKIKEDSNLLIKSANRSSDINSAFELIGKAGALELRGKEIRKRWSLEVKPEIKLWLESILRMLEILPKIDFISFPLDSIDDEKKKFLERNAPIIKIEKVYSLHSQNIETEESDKSVDVAVDELIDLLFADAGLKLDKDLIGRFKEKKEKIVPRLIDILNDESLYSKDADGNGRAPLFAMELLGHLSVVEAIDNIIDITLNAEDNSIVRKEGLYSLELFGPTIIEPVSKFLKYSEDDKAKVILAEVICKIKNNDQVFNLLFDLFKKLSSEESKLRTVKLILNYDKEKALKLFQSAIKDTSLSNKDKEILEASLS